MAHYNKLLQCSIEGCPELAHSMSGWCSYCFGVYCLEHEDRKYHRCLRESEDWCEEYGLLQKERRFQETVDIPSITAIVASIKPDLKFKMLGHEANDDENRNQGLLHRAIKIIWDDGSLAIVRVEIGSQPFWPAELTRMVDSSNVATMNVLNAAGVSVPRVLKHFVHSSPGKDSITMSCMNGDLIDGDRLESVDDNDQAYRHKFIADFARQQILMSHIGFQGIGSLYPSPNDGESPIVGPLLSRDCFSLDHAPWFHGPFRTVKERYIVQINDILSLILQHKLYLHAPADFYLMHLEAKALIDGCDEMAKECEMSYICHKDPHVGQFLVDDYGAISGWLDWDWAVVTTKEEAFAGPAFLGAEWKEDVTAALANNEKLLMQEYEKLGRPDLARCIEGGKKYQILDALLGTWEFSIGELRLLRHAFLGDSELPVPPKTYEEWLAGAKQRYKDTEEWAKFLEAFPSEGLESVEAVGTELKDVVERSKPELSETCCWDLIPYFDLKLVVFT